MKSIFVLGLIFGMTSAILADTVATRAATSRPATVIAPANCVTAECHANVKTTPVVHGPVATNHCDSCHEITDVARHTFAVSRKNADLCTYCHEFSVAGMPTVHAPVTQGQCLGCHDPHGGQTRAITREQTTAQLCGRCHENVMEGNSFVHSPVAQGACDSCHPPHAAKFPKLLDVVGSDLCLACHKEFEPAMASAKFRHKALDKGCTECHNAHGSNAPMSLVKKVPDLCAGCHEKMQKKIAAATVTHSAISSDRSCLNCHTSHASNVARMLTELPATGCLKCHSKPAKRSDGSIVAAVPEVADVKLVKHGEIKDGQCSGCHEVHGGQNPLLLIKPFSQAFYQNFSADNYALCFACHDATLAKEKKTAKATGFRNGNENLHFVHANIGTRDKNCRACHLTHAGPNPRIIRSTLKFGKWDMPIAYIKTATGGSCMPGCHAQYAYDREHPVATTRPTTAPTTMPALATPRSENEDAKFISWSATDINGENVEIPGKSKPVSVLILLSGDDSSCGKIIQQLQSAAPIDAAAQYVVIVGGNKSTDVAKSLAAGPSKWPVVTDASHDAAKILGVSGWPTVLVLRPDGLEVARLSGAAEFLPVKLMAYIDLASGKISTKNVADRLTTKTVTESPAATRISRDLRVARSLLDENKPDQAITYLDRDAKAGPPSPEAQALRSEALIQLKRYEDALTILNRLPANALPEPRLALLCAQAYIGQDHREWARPLLEECVTKFPASAEAHYLLGQVYEKDQNIPKAAEQYKAASELSRGK